jgi:hypothetical protein
MRSVCGLIVATSLAFVACSSNPEAGPAGPNVSGASDAESTGTARSPEVWSRADDPAIFGGDLQRNLASLPTRGAAAVTPWAGSYWPTYRDSINYKWDGSNSDSPARKYELAFGGTNTEAKVSAYFGIDSIRGNSCVVDAQCDSGLGEVCSKHHGAASGTCIASWFGVCHAWAPAAILLPEPKHGVTVNGVDFHVSDI